MTRIVLTKEELQRLGITDVTRDGKIYHNGKECNQYYVKCKHPKSGNDKSYWTISLYDAELYKEQLKDDVKYKNGMRTFLVSRVVYAWYHDMCPSDLDVDHIDDNPNNNSIDNLQLLTRADNLKKRGYARNQYTCSMSEEEYEKYKKEYLDVLRDLNGEVDRCKNWVEDVKEELENAIVEWHCDIKLFNDFKKTKFVDKMLKKHREEINELRDELKRAKDAWHQWSKRRSDFKKSRKSCII